jgi:hypothetical protein
MRSKGVFIASIIGIFALTAASCANKDGVTDTGKTPPVVQVAGGPPPTVAITANGKIDALVLTPGTTVHLEWSSQNATSCSISSKISSDTTSVTETWGNTFSGNHDVTPAADQVTYTLTCANANGNASTKVDLYVSKPCTGGKTVIELLTSSVKNLADNQIVEYRISFQSCDGSPKPVPSGKLWYDEAAVDVSGTLDLPYSIKTDDGTVQVSGTMHSEFGEDLFGHTGDNYFHFLTDKSVTFPSNLSSFKLTVDVSQTEMHSYDTDLTKTIPATEKVNTFLRIGDSEPDVANITVVNQ